MQDNTSYRSQLYKNLIGSGKVTENELGTEDSFINNLSSPDVAKKFHSKLSSVFTPEEIGDENQFVSSLIPDFEKQPLVVNPLTYPKKQDEIAPIIDETGVFNRPDPAIIESKLSEIKNNPIVSRYEELQGRQKEKENVMNYSGADAMTSPIEVFRAVKRSNLNTDEQKFLNENKAQAEKLINDRKALYLQKEFVQLADNLEKYNDSASAVSKFFTGLTKTGTLKDFATLGLTAMSRNLNLLNTLKKAEKQEVLTEEEKTLLKTYNSFKDLERNQDLSFAYKAGKTFQDMIPFVANMIITGGLTSGLRASVGGALKLGTWQAAKEAGVKGVSKYAIKKLAEGAVINAVRSPLTTTFGKTLSENVVNRYQTDNKGNASFDPNAPSDTKLLYDTYVQNYLEYFTEELGGAFSGDAAKSIVAPIFKNSPRIKALFGGTINALNKIGGNKYTQAVKKVTDLAQINGIVGENMEEVINAGLSTALTGSQDWKQFTDNPTELIGLTSINTLLLGGSFTAARYGIGSPSVFIENHKNKKNLNNAINYFNAETENYNNALNDYKTSPEYDAEFGDIITSAIQKAAEVVELAKKGEFSGPDNYTESSPVMQKLSDFNALTEQFTGAEDLIKSLGSVISAAATKQGVYTGLVEMAKREMGDFENKGLKNSVIIANDADGNSFYVLDQLEQDGKEPLVVVKPINGGEISTVSSGIFTGEKAGMNVFSIEEYVDNYLTQRQGIVAQTEQSISEQIDNAPVDSSVLSQEQPQVSIGASYTLAGNPVKVVDITDDAVFVQDEAGNIHDVQPSDLMDDLPMPTDGTTTYVITPIEQEQESQQQEQPQEPQIPLTKDGKPDFDNMPPTMLVEQLQANGFDDTEITGLVSNVVTNLEKQRSLIDKKAVKSINEATERKSKLKEIDTKINGLKAIIEPAPQEQITVSPDKTENDIFKQKHNSLITSVRTHNMQTPGKKKNTNIAPLLRKANELGYTIKPDNFNNLSIFDKDGNLVNRIISDRPNVDDIQQHKSLSEYSQEFQDFVGLMFLSPDNLVYILPLDRNKIAQGIVNIGENKKTIAANDVLDALEQIFTDRQVTLTDTDGKRVDVSLDEYLQVVLDANDLPAETIQEDMPEDIIDDYPEDNIIAPVNVVENDLTLQTNTENEPTEQEASVSENADTENDGQGGPAIQSETQQGGNSEVSPINQANEPVTELEAKQDEIEQQELETATHPDNDLPQPTQGQKEAGNYKKGHVTIQGLDVTIENPKGSIRSGIDSDGESWSQEMKNTYGYILGTTGKDADHIDVFLGENPLSKKVFVIDQINKNKLFDEHKVMLGFNSIEEAQAAYLSNYEEGWQGLGNATETTVPAFTEWAKAGTRRIKPFAEYKQSKEQKEPWLNIVGVLSDFAKEEFEATKSQLPPKLRERITVASSSTGNENQANFIQDYNIDGKSSGIYRVGFFDSAITANADYYALDDFNVDNMKDWERWENLFNEYMRLHPGINAHIKSESGAVFHNIVDALNFKKWSEALDISEEKAASILEEHFGEKNNVANLKQQQFEIISASNPMLDEIHTGIRRVEDIKTAEEAFAKSLQDNEDATPDFTASDMDKALKTGTIIIYSSYPIKNGVFISPSKMQAEAYSGNKKVFKKEVKISEIAWIDQFEGQYAKTEPQQQPEQSKMQEGETIKTNRDESSEQKAIGKTKEIIKDEGGNGYTGRGGNNLYEEVAKSEQKIEDFGEKIEGAKKDRYKLKVHTEQEIGEQPLSKSFPRPDFVSLVKDNILSSDGAMILKFLYDNIPSKPRKTYRILGWVKTVQSGIDAYNSFLASEENVTKFMDGLKKSQKYSSLSRDFFKFSEIQKVLGFPETDINTGAYEIKKFDDGWFVVRGQFIVYKSESVEGAAEGLKKILSGNKKDSKETTFGVYQDRKTQKYFIGKKTATGVQRLIDNIETIKEARTIFKEQNAQLQELWSNMKFKVEERRGFNRDRVGTNYRKGKDVTPEEFGDIFGFRGVQFGNWVNNKERQGSLNDAYDAFMDLATALEISPKSVSLGGELGIAFGARGGGEFSAHYEPAQIVINLTKTKGAGSLAHEWWHALDNYFSRMKGKKLDYFTDSPTQGYKRDINNTIVTNESVRKEMADAFYNVVNTIRKSELPKRSERLDETRSKLYWSTVTEMSARSFENFIIERLGLTNEQNDYLANFKEIGEWINSGFDNKSYPYPLAEESASINESFQQLFNTIEEKVSDEGNVILYRSAEPLPDKIIIDGIERSTKNNLGNPIAPTEEGIRNFWKWFNDSKVVDEQGNPLVVYHGTGSSGITKFKMQNGAIGKGVYFSSVFEEAADYASEKLGEKLSEENDYGGYWAGKYIYEAYLNILNNNQIAKSKYGIGEYIFLATNPSQIKSAIGNNGEFSAENNDIRYREASGITTQEKTFETQALAEKLNISVNIITDITEIPATQSRMRQAKGWFNPKTGEISVVIPNNTSVADIQATILHEAVAHKGLRGLLGSEFVPTMEKIFDSLPDETKGTLISKYGTDKTICAEEYCASIAENDIEPTLWEKIKGFIRDAFRKIGINLQMNDADASFMLWRSKNRLKSTKNATVKETIEDVRMSEQAKLRLRDIGEAPESNKIQLDWLEKKIERWQDRMISVKRLIDEVKSRGGKVAISANPYIQENPSSSEAKAEIDLFKKWFWQPLMKQVTDIEKEYGKIYAQISEYRMAKHAKERNKKICSDEITRSARQKIKSDVFEPILEKYPRIIEEETSRIYDNIFYDKQLSPKDYSNLTDLEIKELARLRKYIIGKATEIAESKQGNNRSGYTDIDAEDIIQEFESVVPKDVTDKLHSLIKESTDFTLNTWLKYGLISKEHYNAMTGPYSYEYYTPLRGWEEKEDIDYTAIFSQDIMGSSILNTNKSAEGRTSKADDPFANIASMAESAVITGNKNEIRRAAWRMVVSNKDMTDLFILRTSWFVNVNEVGEEPMWVEVFDKPTQQLFDEGRARLNINRSYDWHKTSNEIDIHSVPVFIDGQRMVIEIKGELGAKAATAINNMNTLSYAAFRPFAKANRWIAANLTSKNLDFMLTNFIRDYFFGNISYFVKGGSVKDLNKNIITAFRAIHNDRFDRNVDSEIQKMYNDFKLNGGQTGYIHLNGVEQFKKDIERLRLHASGVYTLGDRVLRNKVMTAGANALEYMALMSENAMRFAVYKTELERLMKEAGVSEPNQSMKTLAAQASKDITVNFNRRGAQDSPLAAFFGSMFAFFNASIQGTTTFLKLAKEDPVRFTEAMTAMIALSFLGSLFSALLSGGDDDDKEYDRITDYVKFNNIVLLNPLSSKKDEFITIPTPHGFRAFASMGPLVVDIIRGKKTELEAMGELAKNIAGEISPLSLSGFDLARPNSSAGLISYISPTPIRPFVEAYATNQDYMGNEIAKKNFISSKDGITPQWKLAPKSTNKVLVGTSKFINSLFGGTDNISSAVPRKVGRSEKYRYGFFTDFNPARIEHIFEGYLGGRLRFWNDVYKTTNSIIDKEVPAKQNIPVFRRFYQEPKQKSGWPVFYETRDYVEQIDARMKDFKDRGDIQGEISLNNYYNNSIVSIFKSYEKQVLDLSKMINDVNYERYKPNLEKSRDGLLRDFENRIYELNKTLK